MKRLKGRAVAAVLGLMAGSLGGWTEGFGQTINVDVDAPSGPGAGVPLVTFGAAAATPGRWNALPPTGAGPFRLLLLNSATSSVTVTRTGPAASFGRTPSVITGDHARLLGDIQNIANPNPADNPGSTLTVSGLAPGDYELYTYAIAPDSSTLRSIVTVTPSIDGPATVGGTLPNNTFTVGVTHSVHRFAIVADDEDLVINVRGGTASPGSLSGFQIKQITPGRLYVDASQATPPEAVGPGRSWGTAFGSIGEAMAARAVMDGFANRRLPAIWVANGTYRPTTGTDRASSFVFGPEVELVGGFAGVAANGGETEPSLRSLGSPVVPGSVLSGDIGVAADRSDNSRTVVRLEGAGTVRLDGFTIADGNNDTAPSGQDSARAGGVVVTSTAAELRNFALRNNASVGDGAGMVIGAGASVTWAGGSISGCSGANGAGADHRGVALTVTGVVAKDNRASGFGGVLRVGGGGTATLTRCDFETGRAGALSQTPASAGMPLTGGGGAIRVESDAGMVRAINSRMLRCEAGDLGSAVWAARAVDLIGCVVDGGRAGAGAIVAAPGSRVVNCTVVRNLARSGQTGGVIGLSGLEGGSGGTPALVEVTNSVVWDNRGAAPEQTSAKPVRTLGGGVHSGTSRSGAALSGDALVNGSASMAQIAGGVLARASIVEGWGVRDGLGNTGLDPRFRDADGADGVVSTVDDDLTPGPRGPGSDSGDSVLFDLATSMATPPVTVEMDVRGRPRVYDDLVVMNGAGVVGGAGGVGGGLTNRAIDRGAFEQGCLADTNGNGTVSIQELFDFLSAWFARSIAADINGNGLVSVEDIFDYLERFVLGC